MTFTNPLSTRFPKAQFFVVCTFLPAVIATSVINNAKFTTLVIILLGIFIVFSYNNKKFSDPISVFVLFYIPYSTWYGIHTFISEGVLEKRFEESLSQALLLSLLGLVAYVLAGAIFRLIFKLGGSSHHIIPKPKPVGPIFLGLILVACILIGFAVLQAASLSLTTKREILDANLSSVSSASFAAFIVAAGALLVGWNSYIKNGFFSMLSNPVFLICCLSLTAMMLVLGERDAVFRFIFTMILIYYMISNRATTTVMITVLTLTVISIPITQSLKSIFLGGIQGEFVINDIFSGEFVSALRNTQRLIFNGVDHTPMFIWTDILRASSPFVRSEDIVSTTSWYHNVYRVEHNFSGTAGWGLGYVAQGYLVANTLGVIGIMAFISVVIHFLFFWSRKNDLLLVFYAFSLATAIYGIRADLANFLSQTFKIGGAVVLIFAVARMIDLSLTFRRPT